MKEFKLFALSFVGLAFVSTAQAAVIITPISANASSQKTLGGPGNTIDGSGLYTDATKTTPDNSITGIHFDSGSSATDDAWSWVWNDGSTSPSNPVINGEWIEYDLGAVYSLTGAYVWQTVFSTTGRQTRTFDIDTSTDDASYTRRVTNALLPQVTTLANGATATYFSLGSTVSARYVRLEINGTYENSAGNQNWLGGIGEAKFEVEAVPEPSSALLAMGGAAMLFIRRRAR